MTLFPISFGSSITFALPVSASLQNLQFPDFNLTCRLQIHDSLFGIIVLHLLCKIYAILLIISMTLVSPRLACACGGASII